MGSSARQVFAGFPEAVRASHLLGGEVADFIINAYLALQHQWPDRGGYTHYQQLLAERAAARAEVLRQIAASANALLVGVRFIDDLPPDHAWDAQAPLPAAAAELGTRLRLARAVADIAVLRDSAGQLVSQPVQAAVQLVADAQLAGLSLLESRLNTLAQRMDALTPPPRPQRRSHRPSDWRALRERLGALEVEVAQLRAQAALPLAVGAAPGALDQVLAYLGAVPLGADAPEEP